MKKLEIRKEQSRWDEENEEVRS